MPRTLKNRLSRSSGYKAKQFRRMQKVEDRNSHGSNRVTNKGATEINFTKFNCKTKFGRHIWPVGSPEPYNPGQIYYDNEDDVDDYNWKDETLIEYLERTLQEEENQGGHKDRSKVAALKQLKRRGVNQRFVSHGRRYKALDYL